MRALWPILLVAAVGTAHAAKDKDQDEGDGKFDTGPENKPDETSKDEAAPEAEATVENRDAGGGDRVRLRTSLTSVYYGESSSDPQLASPNALTYADLRMRLEADSLGGSRWATTDDLRLRLASDDGARGQLGGQEIDIAELWLGYRGATSSWRLGRIVAEEVDALTFDGTSLAFKLKPGWELGLVGGLYPSPFSRSLDSDYQFAADDDRSIGTYPAGGALWLAYRQGPAWGSVGAGAIAPRAQGMVSEDTRVFVTARGYWRINPEWNVFHDAVLDVAGAAGVLLTRGIAGVTYRPHPSWLVEAGYSHMSTYAIEVFLRDLLLDTPVAFPAMGDPARPINNLDVARVAADEGRLGVTWMNRDRDLSAWTMLRYRKRDAITTPDLATPIADLPADSQLDVSVGLRKLDLFSKVNSSLDVAVLSGDRTSSKFFTLRAWRGFMDDKLDAELAVGYTTYEDACVALPDDQTCSGTQQGSTLRGSLTATYVHDRHWMGFLSYEYAKNSGEISGAPRADIGSNMLILRLQYRY